MNCKRVIFLHIQKTAGTSAFIHLNRALKPQKTLRHGQFSSVSASQLSDYQFIAGHFGFDFIKDIIEDSYSFTFLRDPVQRVLSLYTFCREAGDNPLAKALPVFQCAKSMSIDDFVHCEDPASGIPASIDNTQTWQLAKHYMAEARSTTPPPSEQALYEQAVSNLTKFSHVGFQENYLPHLRCILLDLGFASPQGSCFVNASRNPLDAKSLDSQTLNRLLERLQLDIALYNHAKATYTLPPTRSRRPVAQASRAQ